MYSKKSKVLSFIFSLIPGAGQIYLGGIGRGMLYFILAAAGMTVLVYSVLYDINTLIIFGVSFVFMVWFVSFVDSMILRDRVHIAGKVISNKYTAGCPMPEKSCNENLPAGSAGESMEAEKDKRARVLFISIIPGAGHMYLGLFNRGIQFMGLFFFSLYLNQLLGESLFIYFLPVIWFYALFDSIKNASGDGGMDDSDVIFLSWARKKDNERQYRYKVMGYVICSIGIISILNRIVAPAFSNALNNSYQIKEYIQVAVLAAAFIAGGIKLIKKEGNLKEE